MYVLCVCVSLFLLIKSIALDLEMGGIDDHKDTQIAAQMRILFSLSAYARYDISAMGLNSYWR